MSHLPTLLPLGDSAWTVEFGDRIDPSLHARVMGLNGALHAARDAGTLAGIVDLVPRKHCLETVGPDLVAMVERLSASLSGQSGAMVQPAPPKDWKTTAE